MEKINDVIQAMLKAASNVMQNAYAPYSGFQVGCCINTKNGNLFVGANVENMAYPSCQCAESSAVGAMIATGERHIAEITIVCNRNMFCFPCGNCRQILAEFCDEHTQVHFYDHHELKSVAFNDLLPHQFNVNTSQ